MEFEQFSKEEIENLYKHISKGWNDRLAHVSRVYNLCKVFIKSYPEANKKILLTAALLHDIGHVEKEKHEIKGSEMVKEILKNKKFSDEEIEHVSECIRTHSAKGKEQPTSIEGKILSDCDRIDVINIDNWLQIIDSKIIDGKSIHEAINDCNKWKNEWVSLGIKFYTSKGKEEYKKIQRKKKEIINKINLHSLKILRRGILIYLFDEKLEKILLVKRTKENGWGVIAGTCEENEEFIRTAIRELKEEINIDRFLLELFPSDLTFKINENEKSLDILYHYCTKKKSVDFPRINFPVEIEVISWYPVNRIPINMIPTNIRLNLSRCVENEKES